ncbi:DUF2490 domain-containing protein [Penaeicola halotolerans]|uniref:DUF2490 domain-containing protein n=1 Tax=Penaeicola halotolerans TaxID=2793196 RepID=UPI001CF8336F|nr:DUF2490 domain-containing protein [Penaeicola halotolerans]
MKSINLKLVAGILLLAIISTIQTVRAQETLPEPTPAQRRIVEQESGFWLGLYTKYKIGERLYYYGEYHLRTRDRLIREMAQIYLRFGLSYIVNPNLEITGGIVTPFYWAPGADFGDADPSTYDNIVPQFRFWQQFLFVQPVGVAKLYHQFRTEQRWRRDYEVNSDWELTHRFRYKILSYIPLNSTRLENNTLFYAGYAEVFIQAGKPIISNYLEDIRLFSGLGYIVNENIQLQTGFQWTWQPQNSGFEYKSRSMLRFSIYHNLDFTNRKRKKDNIEIRPGVL